MASRRRLTQKLVLTTESKGATSGFKRATTAASGWAKGLLAAGAAAVGFTKIVGLLNTSTEEAIELYRLQERQLLQLEGRFGDNTEAVISQGKALSDLTGVSQIQITKAQQLAGAMGATTETVKELALASLNLAAAFGTDLEQAARQIAVTLGGYGGELGERIPELKEFTQEQLKAGAAAGLINEKLKDAAREGLSDYERRLRAIKNSLEDVQLATGKAAVETGSFTEAQEEGVKIASAYAFIVREGSAITSLWATVTQTASNRFGEMRNVLIDLANFIIPDLIERFKDYNIQVANSSAAMLENAKALGLLRGGNIDLNKANIRLADSTGLVLKTQKQLTEILGQGSEVVGDAVDVFSKLGVALESDVNKQIAENNRLLALSAAALAQGSITGTDYARVLADVTEKNRLLTESLTDQSDVINSDSLAAIRALGLEYGLSRLEIEGLTAAIRENQAALDPASGGVLGEFGQNRLGLSGGNFSFTTEGGAAAFREAFLERNPGSIAAGAAQPSDLQITGSISP